jgi:hypothetical protein
MQALPRRNALGRDDAVYVDLRGRYTGGAQPIESARMLGLVVARARATLFVKLVGDASAVAAQAVAFDAFVASLRVAAPAAPATEPAPPGGGDGGAGRLHWSAPPGWQRGDAASMRLVTYHPGGDRDVQAYVVILAGEAGGVAANFDRWLGQVGRPPMTAAERERLPRIRLLAADVPLLEAYGAEQGVLGVAGRLGDDSLFVKMTGPNDGLRAARESFVAFCRSLAVR